MKTKPINLMKTITTCYLVLLLAVFANTADAQERDADTKPTQPTLSEGLLIKHETATVETRSQNADVATTTSQTKEVSDGKPTIDLTTTFERGFEGYEEAYITWIKATPDYELYLTNEEKAFLAADDYKGLYQHNHAIAVAAKRQDVPTNEKP